MLAQAMARQRASVRVEGRKESKSKGVTKRESVRAPETTRKRA